MASIMSALVAVRDFGPAEDRNGSNPEKLRVSVRLSAITGCEQSLQNNPYSITSSARMRSVGGTVRPSAFAV